MRSGLCGVARTSLFKREVENEAEANPSSLDDAAKRFVFCLLAKQKPKQTGALAFCGCTQVSWVYFVWIFLIALTNLSIYLFQ